MWVIDQAMNLGATTGVLLSTRLDEEWSPRARTIALPVDLPNS